MNMSEKVQEIDYEQDVLRFKKIWDQMKQTHKPSPNIVAPSSNKQNKSKVKEYKSKEKPTKKQAIVSSKNIQRNPKPNPETVIEVVTNPLGFSQNRLENQKNRMNKETLLQIPPTENQNKISDVRSLQRQIEEKDYQLSLLRVNNTRNQDKIRVLESQITLKDKKISDLETQQRLLISKTSSTLDQERLFDYGKVQYENFKNDSKRLLKMLQNTNQYQTFANLALDDNGVRFLHTVNEKLKGELDSTNRVRLHFCTCNKDFIPQSSFWVPEKIYSYGKEFIKQRNGQVTAAQLQLLLYDLNKIWRQREKRIINTITSQKSKEIEQLKRKIANHKKNKQE